MNERPPENVSSDRPDSPQQQEQPEQPDVPDIQDKSESVDEQLPDISTIINVASAIPDADLNCVTSDNEEEGPAPMADQSIDPLDVMSEDEGQVNETSDGIQNMSLDLQKPSSSPGPPFITPAMTAFQQQNVEAYEPARASRSPVEEAAKEGASISQTKRDTTKPDLDIWQSEQ